MAADDNTKRTDEHPENRGIHSFLYRAGRAGLDGAQSAATRVDTMLTHKLGGPERKRIILLLAAILGLNGANSGGIGAMAAQLEPSLHIGNVGLGLLVTASSVAGAVATIPIGILADRVIRTRVLLVGLALWTVAEAVSGFSSSITMLIVSQLFLGAAAATAGPTVASLTGDFFPSSERGRIYGFILTGELVGAGFGIVVAGDLGAAIGWRSGFILLAVAGAGLTWLVYRYLPEPARGGSSRLVEGADTSDNEVETPQSRTIPAGVSASPSFDETLVNQAIKHGFTPTEMDGLPSNPEYLGIVGAVRYILGVKTNLLLILASSMGYFFFAGVRTFAVLFISRRFGIPQALTTLLVPLVGGGAIIGILLAGRISDRLIRRGMVDARMVVAAVSYFIAVALFLPALLTSSLLIGIPLVILAGAAIGAPNPPLDAARLDVMPSRMWGRAEAVRTALRTLLESAAPLLFGYLSAELGGNSTNVGTTVNPSGSHMHEAALSGGHAHGLDLAFLVMLIPLTVSGILVWRARHYYPRDVLAAARIDGARTEP